jgi:protein ImuB
MVSLNRMLFGCIYIPDFPVQAAIRHESGVIFKTSPVIVLDGADSRQKVCACNQAARQQGITIGMKKVQLQVLPGVVMRKRRCEEETEAQAALIDCGYALSSRVESTCAGTVIVDLSGAERLMGPPLLMARKFVELAAQCNLQGRIAIAANPDAALHAARGFEEIMIIAHGTEAAKLASLPVEILNPDPEALETLLNWGITNFKSLADVPVISLVHRLGQRGLSLQQLARGGTHRDLVLSVPAGQFKESIELEEPVDLLEPLSFILNRLLIQLVARLKARSLATDHLQVNLGLEVHSERQLRWIPPPAANETLIHQRTLKLPVPAQDAHVFLKLLQLDLAAHPPMAPVKKISIEAFPARPRCNQGGLFQPSAPEPAALEVTLGRLQAVTGESDEEGRLRVGFPAIRDTHKPDSFDLRRSSASVGKEQSLQPSRPKLALRVLRPPLKIHVELLGDEPSAIIIYGKRKRVIHASGPWNKNGAWWNGKEDWSYEEWDLELDAPGMLLYHAFRDCRSGSWFLAGRYD